MALNQPDLAELLEAVPQDETSLTVSSMGADVNLIRIGGPVWLRLSGSMSQQSGGQRDRYAQLSFGTHMALGPQTFLGLMGTLDSMHLTDPLGQTAGQGCLVGPDFVSRIGETSLAFEARALTGRTQDRVAQAGHPASMVKGERSLVMAKLSGTYALTEHLTLRPKPYAASVTEATAAYLAAGGTPIPAISTSYSQQSLSLDLRHESVNTYGELTLTGGLGWFRSDDTVSQKGQRRSYFFGIQQQIGSETSIRFGVSGQRDFDNRIDRVGLSLQLEARF